VTGILGPAFDAADVEALWTEVLPKYLSFFNALAIDRLVMAPKAAVLACGPMASSMVEAVADRLPGAIIRGLEPSRAAIDATLERSTAFTHAVVVHPLSGAASRLMLLKEAFRVLVPAGQLLFTLPLRGSCPEIADMLREFSLKHDKPKFAEAIEIASQSRPTPETLTDDLERLGFTDVGVDVELLSVAFETGKDFANHPLFRLIIAPEMAALIGDPAEGIVNAAIEYAKTSIAKYWSEGQFDLTVNLGCAIARKP
jgi:SAM-dependent methyltransferase